MEKTNTQKPEVLSRACNFEFASRYCQKLTYGYVNYDGAVGLTSLLEVDTSCSPEKIFPAGLTHVSGIRNDHWYEVQHYK